MGKGFSKDNPLKKLETMPKSTEVKKISQATDKPKQTEPELHQEEPPVKQKRKVGRPKTKDVKATCRNINVAIPTELLEKWEDIKIVHGSNLTAYITKLIKKDMDNNYEKYKDFADSIKNM